tara:strand:+ start:166 stop:372 length:207 start_codon:yes stop_codon:yes gene_type:complete
VHAHLLQFQPVFHAILPSRMDHFHMGELGRAEIACMMVFHDAPNYDYKRAIERGAVFLLAVSFFPLIY